MSTDKKLISNNRKALHDYYIENTIEAGIVLQGWEVKSIRAGKVQLRDSYIKIKNNEVWLIGCNISPLLVASTHITPELVRTRKLLLQRKEIDKLLSKVDQKGYSIIPLDLHFKQGLIKICIALARGKQNHDKRQVIKEREAILEASRVVKHLKYNR